MITRRSACSQSCDAMRYPVIPAPSTPPPPSHTSSHLSILLSCISLPFLMLSLLPPLTSSLVFTPTPTLSALLIVDMQLCFSPNGSLPVPSYLSLIPRINRLHRLPLFSHVVLTQDYHPPDHISFTSTHPSHLPFSSLPLSYDSAGRLCSAPPSHPPCDSSLPLTPLHQTLWPPHCIAGTPDVAFHPDLLHLPTDVVVRKGASPHVDAYSAFSDSVGRWSELGGMLEGWGVGRVYVVGVALDVCVMATALDAVRGGWEVWVVRDATAGIGDGVKEVEDMMRQGVRFTTTEDIDGYADSPSSVENE